MDGADVSGWGAVCVSAVGASARVCAGCVGGLACVALRVVSSSVASCVSQVMAQVKHIVKGRLDRNGGGCKQ